MPSPPILDNKEPDAPSVFEPAALLREARRQKGLPVANVPPVCVLDPDGDIVRRLRKEGRSRSFDGWPCYHTQLDAFELAGRTAGIVGCAVGAPFAVLIAEEMFASGCSFLISLTSAGQIVPAGPTPYFVIIDRALRDEGTSYHYAAPTEYGEGGGGTRRQILGQVTDMVDGVTMSRSTRPARLDLVRRGGSTARPRRWSDPDGAIVTRAAGPPRKADVIAALGSMIEPALVGLVAGGE